MKSRVVEHRAKPSVWWVGEADFQSDVALALDKVFSTFEIEFDLVRIQDDAPELQKPLWH